MGIQLFETCTTNLVQMASPIPPKVAWNNFFGPERSKVEPDRARPAGARPPGPLLAGRWAASREWNEGRAQEGEQRAGGDGAHPPLLSP